MLHMDKDFVEDIGELIIKLNKDPRAKTEKKAVVTFESKQIRDSVRAQAYKLANHHGQAGMRLHLPDHLQKDFKSLMSLAYEMKKKNPDLKRNVKFDEDTLGLYMDVQVEKDGSWRRISADQSKKIGAPASKRGGPAGMEDDVIRSLLGGTDEEDSETTK